MVGFMLDVEGLCGNQLIHEVEMLADQLGLVTTWLAKEQLEAGALKNCPPLVVVVFCGAGSQLARRLDESLDVPVFAVPMAGENESPLDVLQEVAGAEAGGGAGRLALGTAGARNAVLAAASLLALGNPDISKRLDHFRKEQTRRVLNIELSDKP